MLNSYRFIEFVSIAWQSPLMAKAKRVRLTVDARREQLIALGLAAFSERPYDGVAVDEIARQAGISRGLVFHYFPTKRAFYLASLGRAADALLEQVFGAATAGSQLDRLRAGLTAYFAYVERHGPAYGALLRGGVGSDGEVQSLVEATRARIIERLRAELPRGSGLGRRQVRATLRGWLGHVEAIALDWIDHRDLDAATRVDLALRPLATLVPLA
jgi:AcrR family transcriptional regulator